MTKLKSISKRTLSVLLCMMMLLTVFMSVPFSASAETQAVKVDPIEVKTYTAEDIQINSDAVAAKETPASTGASTERVTYDGLSYLLYPDTNEATLTSSDDSIPVDLVIPSTVDGYTVTKIGMMALDSKELKSVFIPATVKEIDRSAFSGCTSLESVVFEEGSQLKYIWG